MFRKNQITRKRETLQGFPAFKKLFYRTLVIGNQSNYKFIMYSP